MKKHVPGALCTVGIILVTVGIVQIWQPLAWIVGGVLLHRKESNRTE